MTFSRLRFPERNLIRRHLEQFSLVVSQPPTDITRARPRPMLP